MPYLLPLLAIALPILLVPFVLALPPRWGTRLVLAGPASVAVVGAVLWGEATRTPRRLLLSRWAPSIDIEISLVIDRLGVFFLLLIGVVGLAVIQYARAYFRGGASKGFWALMLLFMASMSGMVLADSLVLFYLFWEMTTVSSALLIGGNGTLAEARRGAIQAFLVTGLGGLCLLAGIVLVGLQSEAFDFSSLAHRREELQADPRHLLPLGLMLVGAFAKSAQVPFHFWLPGAMAASTPVSAYLHSATMVQAGLVLVSRLLPAFGGSPLWLPLLSTVGLATFVIAGWSALRSWDLKRLLAYSTAAYLGLVTAYYGCVGSTGLHDDLMLIANHALYKSALFLLVGWIERVTGTRDLRTLAPERWVQHVPAGALLFGIGVMAMAGAPLLLGFASKELFFSALLAAYGGTARWVVASVAVAASGLALGYALKFGNVFFGREAAPLDRGHPRREVSPWLVAVPALLLAPQVLGGLSPQWLAASLQPRTRIAPGLAFWHHVDVLLVLSLAGYLLGIVLFAVWQPLARARTLPSVEQAVGTSAKALMRFASWFSKAVQAGGHPRYISLIALSVFALIALAAARSSRFPWSSTFGIEGIFALPPTVLVVAGVSGALFLSDRASKAIALGMVGFGVALFYALFRAPDLVLTQVLVESLSLVLLLLAFHRLPALSPDRRGWRLRTLHAAIGLATGLGLAFLALSAASLPASDPAGRIQFARSLPDAHGRNAVNVILVDFRGADTLGEIAVLAIAALGALVLLRSPSTAPRAVEPQSRILERAAFAILPATLVFAVYLLLRGHDAPGGGFIAGLVVALALILEAIALGAGVIRRRLHGPAHPALAAGLLLSTTAASLALAFQSPFFTHVSAAAWSAGGQVFSTTLLFELGVFTVVIVTGAVFASVLGKEEP